MVWDYPEPYEPVEVEEEFDEDRAYEERRDDLAGFNG